MGGVSRYLLKISGSGVALTLLNHSSTGQIQVHLACIQQSQCLLRGRCPLQKLILPLALQPRPPLTGVSRAVRARNPERVSKESPGAGIQKVSETVSKQSPESQNRLFRDSGDCFETVSDTFWTPGPEGLGREGPGDSCKGWAGLQLLHNMQESGVFQGWTSKAPDPFCSRTKIPLSFPEFPLNFPLVPLKIPLVFP